MESRNVDMEKGFLLVQREHWYYQNRNIRALFRHYRLHQPETLEDGKKHNQPLCTKCFTFVNCAKATQYLSEHNADEVNQILDRNV